MNAAYRKSSLALVGAALALLLLPAAARAQNDDFDDNNSDGWTELDPLAAVSPPSVASFSTAQGNYRISSPESPVPGFGGARAGSLRQDFVYTDFCVVVDIVAFDIALEQSIGILARIQPDPGIGAVNGYALTVQASTNDIDISLITGEEPSALDANAELLTPLDSAKTYRMVFLGVGSYLEGRLYDMDDLKNPIAMVSTNDLSHSEGTCGLVVADLGEPDGAIDATFDNYRASDGTPPSLTITKDAFDEGSLFWPDYALCWKLQSSDNLTNGSWTDVPPETIVHQTSRDRFIISLFFFDEERQNYWRLVPFDGT